VTKKRQRCASCRCKDERFSADGFCPPCERAQRAHRRLEAAASEHFRSMIGLMQASPRLHRMIQAKAAELLQERAKSLS